MEPNNQEVLLVFLISVLLRSLLQMSTLTKGPVFRAEDSYTHRHLCEFTGIDVEMEIKEHYSEVMDIVDHLFVNVFDKLKERCQKELDAIGKQYPITPLKEAGYEVDSHGDLNTETERTLGKIVGEEIISGAQCVHVPELLETRAKACGIDVNTTSTYIDAFRYGAPPHGGFGVGLERVVMLFCALNNIRKTSLFPRDPRRLAVRTMIRWIFQAVFLVVL
ncbi:hypothetical protein CTI12_AA336800 [Artemisia annua]|uniref:Aminoacyl-transfer RNA synthetases class-II family profile domain-containing protein n=1 Tax=Artemisia annua TaxID=35608 RepID=A0A2U1MVR6_ARTAN|nr:hypothetical protein CTI12_AA336800 [Artemisia annua]